MRSASWKLKAAAGGAAVVAGVGGGLALTNSHTTAVHDSAFYYGFGDGNSGYGNMLSSAVTNLQQGGVSSGISLRALQELGAIHGMGTQFNVYRHHQMSMLAFQRGQIVLLTHHFLVVRGLNGQLTVWRLSGNTAVKSVATTPATQAAAPVAAVPVLTTGTAATAVTGAMPVTTVLNNTAVAAAAPTVTTVSVTTGTTTVTVTITNTAAAATVAPVARVVTPTTTTVMPTAALTWRGLAAGDLVFVAGSVSHHTRVAQLVLIEALATTTPTVTPTITPTPTVTPTITVKPAVTPTVTPTVTVTPTAPAAVITASPSTTPTNS